ncbi:oxepin-CoA hydrolase, alternative type [Phaeobacter sp. B1627]|uniref:oxepin-CoA hydrolase, alternative type n=1 Tax=Phaeobacter sp. B1627 TaxID=2583809 RepID=UPI0011194FEE|nr:enoyl-CoA hydratase family protein [Phaeobacter sp. B1627]TNJ44428.1 enoyl-CoA hydratase [Phaeobacter sp. B1627]
MGDLFRSEHRGDHVILWNCNGARRNALSPDYYAGVITGLEAAADDPSTAAVILAGEGDFFCAGGDLTLLKARRAMSLEERKANIEKLHDVIRAIRNCPKPVIAAVEGGAAGAGLSIAMACDLIVAGADAKFTLAYVKAGLVPDGGATWTLSRVLPRATLAQMAMLGRPIGAGRLHALGVVSELVADGTVLDAAAALAGDIARGPQQAITSIKQLLTTAEASLSLEDQLARERDAMAVALGGEEARIGITAFLNKAQPVFR